VAKKFQELRDKMSPKSLARARKKASKYSKEIDNATRKRARKSRTPESGVLAEILQCLRNHRILCFRMNVGVHQVGSRFIRYGVKGMSDVLAFPKKDIDLNGLYGGEQVVPLWIEAKSRDGRQGADQKIFQQVVEADGHWYVVVRSYEELDAYLKSKGVIR
jgi:hypothetical protein